MARTIASTCPLDCADACGVLVEVGDDGELLRLKGDQRHGHSRGTLCGKTMLYGELRSSQERVLHPLVRKGGRLERASWDEALDVVCERVARLRPADILALWYGGTMGLVQRKFPLRAMHALGATFHDGGVCDAAGQEGYAAVLGRCVGPDIEDVEHCDLVGLWGCDAARTVQHIQAPLRRAQQGGAGSFVVDIWRTDTLKDVEARGGEGFVVRPGSDSMLCLALARLALGQAEVDRHIEHRRPRQLAGREERHAVDHPLRRRAAGHRSDDLQGIRMFGGQPQQGLAHAPGGAVNKQT